MAWDDSPPTAEEVKAGSWDSAPPTKEEIRASAKEPESIAHGAYRGWSQGTGVLPGIKEAMKSQNDYLESTGKPVEGGAPLAIPASAAPSALLKIASVLEDSAPARIAANAAVGSAQGALADPGEGGSRTRNAIIGGGVGGGISALGELLAKAIPTVGGKLTNMGKADTEAYMNDPKLAEDMYSLYQNDPEGLNQSVRNQIKGDLSTIFQEKSQPILDARGKLLAGKTVSVDPSQFAGTAAEKELSRIAALTPGENATTGTMTLTGPQAQGMKKILQDAADYSSTAAKLNPMQYGAQNEADALAAGNAGKAISGVAPGVDVFNAELSRNARMNDAANSIFNSNPARILNNSESIGNTNVRALQKYLDQTAGSNYGQMADALSAGRALNNPSKFGSGAEGLIERLLTDPIGRMMLKSSGIVTPVLQSPLIPQTMVNSQVSDPDMAALQRRLSSQ